MRFTIDIVNDIGTILVVIFALFLFLIVFYMCSNIVLKRNKRMGDELESLYKKYTFLSDKIKYLENDNLPLHLTDDGLKLVNDSGFKNIFEYIKDDLIKRFFSDIKPKNTHDALDQAREGMSDLRREEYEPFRPLKTFCDVTGNDYSQLLRVCSVLVRDYYLKKHSEIKR